MSDMNGETWFIKNLCNWIKHGLVIVKLGPLNWNTEVAEFLRQNLILEYGKQ